VSRVREKNRIERNKPVRNIKAYLFVTYKRLLLVELRKRRRLEEFDAPEIRQKIEMEQKSLADDLEQKILAQELMQRMDDKMRYVSEFRILGYTFEEIAVKLTTPANILR